MTAAACTHARARLVTRLAGEPAEAPRRHLERCVPCADQETLVDAALEALAAPARPAPAGAGERLFARIAAHRAEQAARALRAPPVRVVLHCTYCHDGLERADTRHCAACLAPHHAACFDEHGRCAAPGCAGVVYVAPVAPPRAASRRPRRWQVALLAGAAAVGLGVGAAALTDDAPPPAAGAPVVAPPPSAQAPAPAPAPAALAFDLSGTWEPDEETGWGTVTIQGLRGSYLPAREHLPPGTFELTVVGERTVEGRWLSERGVAGPLVAILSADGQTLRGTWAVDTGTSDASGLISWHRVGGVRGARRPTIRETVHARDGSALVWVPAGTFLMGSVSGRPDERPAHEVRLTRGFWIGKHEVTWGQFRAFCAATGRATIANDSRIPPRDDHPVHRATWDDAQAYCAWAGLRLPTEAEWELAARSDDSRTFPWGDTWSDWANLRGGTWRYTSPVGAIPENASPYGALDMAGNLWEWTADWYGPYGSGPRVDPRGPATGEWRVLRGGYWHDEMSLARTSYRHCTAPDTALSGIGFRVVRDE